MPRSIFDFILHFAEIRVIKNVDLVIAETKIGAKQLKRRFRIGKNHITQIYSGIDVKGIESSAGEHRFLLKDTTRILNVGVVTRRKGQIFALRSTISLLRMHRNISVTFVGAIDDSKYYDDLKGEAKASGFENEIKFAGEVKTEQLYDYFTSSDIFVSTSLSETQGLAILEAMYFGLAVVCTSLTPIQEMIGSSESALLVEPQDIQPLTSALDELVSNRALRQSLANKGKRLAASFSWQNTAMKTVERYREQIVRSTL